MTVPVGAPARTARHCDRRACPPARGELEVGEAPASHALNWPGSRPVRSANSVRGSLPIRTARPRSGAAGLGETRASHLYWVDGSITEHWAHRTEMGLRDGPSEIRHSTIPNRVRICSAVHPRGRSPYHTGRFRENLNREGYVHSLLQARPMGLVHSMEPTQFSFTWKRAPDFHYS